MVEPGIKPRSVWLGRLLSLGCIALCLGSWIPTPLVLLQEGDRQKPMLLSSVAGVGRNTEAQAPLGYPDQEAHFVLPR